MFIVVTEQVFTEIWHTISHFKVYKMGLSEKKTKKHRNPALD